MPPRGFKGKYFPPNLSDEDVLFRLKRFTYSFNKYQEIGISFIFYRYYFLH